MWRTMRVIKMCRTVSSKRGHGGMEVLCIIWCDGLDIWSKLLFLGPAVCLKYNSTAPYNVFLGPAVCFEI